MHIDGLECICSIHVYEYTAVLLYHVDAGDANCYDDAMTWERDTEKRKWGERQVTV